MQQNTLQELVLYKPKVSENKFYKTIDEFTEGTLALFTPFDPPKIFAPVIGPWAPSESYQRSQHEQRLREQTPIQPTERIDLSITRGSVKLLPHEGGSPLLRVDRNAHDGKPENHLQFGFGTYTGRHGEEAYDIFAEVFRFSKHNINIGGEEREELTERFLLKKKPW